MSFLLFLSIFSNMTFANNQISLSTSNPNTMTTEELPTINAIPGVIRSVGVKGAFYLLNQASVAITRREPSITLGNVRDTASSGTLTFNSGSNPIATVKKDVEAVKKGHQIEMWANSHQFGWVGKIAVEATQPNRISFINRTVGHNQYSWATFNQTGVHELRYTSTSKDSWTLWQAYYHFGDLRSACPHGSTCPMGSEVTLKSDSSYVLATNAVEDQIWFEEIGDHRFIVPSENHQKTAINFNTSQNQFINIVKPVLTMNDLYYQFYDEKLSQRVDIAKNYKAGDELILIDKISSISFEKSENVTTIVFDSIVGPQYFKFVGDLTNQYRKNDTLRLNFSFVPIIEGEDYITLDYTQSIKDTGQIPSINEFLAKSSVERSLDY